ncbi:MAG TPA: PAS domain S-box protein [Clostridia bacterium]|nr:PAS domain S-box protein [Clostridia bacterium]
MNRKLLFLIVASAFAICFLPLFLSVCGGSQVKAFFDNPTLLYQIKKCMIWAVVIAFSLILVIARIILAVDVNKIIDEEISLLGCEEILRILVNSTPDLVFLKDAEGRYLEINDSTMELFHLDKKSFNGMKKNHLDKLSPLYKELSEKCNALDNKAWETGTIYRTTDIICMPDGTEKTYDIIKTPVFHKNGRRKGIVTLARDITTYREAEEKLEKKERILRATLNATDDGILVVDNNRQVMEANDLYFNMWNIPWDVYSLNNETANLKFVKKQLVDPDTFEAWVNFTYELPVTEHYKAQLLDGRIYDVFSTPLMDKGYMIGRVWSFRDITARIKAESELLMSEERYRTLVELSPDAIFVSMNGRNVFTNMAGVKIMGACSRDEIYKRDILDFIDIDIKALTEQHIDGIINSEEVLSMTEQKIMRLDGKSIDIEAVCSMVPYRGENAVMSVVRDISERKRNEELRHKIDENMKLVRETLEYDKIKTQFFANISHEVKTPLNIIIGTLQLFELIMNDQNIEESFDKLMKYTSIMRQNCFRLLRMLSNLIYITEIDSGFVEMHVHNYDLVQIVKDITAASRRFIESKGVKLEVSIDPASLEIACDSEKMKRVLLNLLSNAVKFTEEGDMISISLYNIKDYAYISVKDTGIGIPDEMKEIIFQRFRQVDKSFTRKCEGSGIGLSLVKSLVEMHGGSITVKSEYGKGSEFIVKLPLWLMENDEIALTSEETANSYMDMVSIEFSDIY